MEKHRETPSGENQNMVFGSHLVVFRREGGGDARIVEAKEVRYSANWVRRVLPELFTLSLTIFQEPLVLTVNSVFVHI